MVTSQAEPVPMPNARAATPRQSRTVLRTYSARTVRARCAQSPFVGSPTKLKRASSGAATTSTRRAAPSVPRGADPSRDAAREVGDGSAKWPGEGRGETAIAVAGAESVKLIEGGGA